MDFLKLELYLFLALDLSWLTSSFISLYSCKIRDKLVKDGVDRIQDTLRLMERSTGLMLSELL